MVRSHLGKEKADQYKANPGNKSIPGKEIIISFDEKEIPITNKESQFLMPYQTDEGVMRLVTGMCQINPKIKENEVNIPIEKNPQNSGITLKQPVHK